eukprot:SAG22_NODE_7359_length_747_cov_2.069444_1_plen_25_part_10
MSDPRTLSMGVYGCTGRMHTGLCSL